jgi:hypothetical protein
VNRTHVVAEVHPIVRVAGHRETGFVITEVAAMEKKFKVDFRKKIGKRTQHRIKNIEIRFRRSGQVLSDSSSKLLEQYVWRVKAEIFFVHNC